jgi:hypothetical protein
MAPLTCRVRLGEEEYSVALAPSESESESLISAADVLSKICPSPPFSISVVDFSLKSTESDVKISSFKDFSHTMVLSVEYDAKTVMRSLIEHPNNSSVSRQCLWLFTAIPTSSSLRKKLSNFGAIEAVTKVMIEFSGDRNTAKLAVKAFRNLSFESPDAALKMSMAGSTSLIMKAIRECEGDMPLAVDGLWSLANVCARPEFMINEKMDEWLEVALPFARTLAQYNDALQPLCVIFSTVLVSSLHKLSEDQGIAIPQLGLRAVRSAGRDPMLCQYGWRLLLVLASSAKIKDFILSEGGVSILLGVIDSCGASEPWDAVLSTCLQCLAAMAGPDKVDLTVVRQANSAKALNKISIKIKSRLSNAGVVESGCRAILKLVADHENPLDADEYSSLLSLIGTAISLYSLNAAVLTALFEAHVAIMQVPGNDVILCSPATIESVLTGLKNHSKFKTDSGSVTSSASNSSRFEGDGTEDAFSKDRAQRIALLKFGCLALFHMMSADTYEAGRLSGGVEVLCHLLTRYRNECEVVASACKALTKLCFKDLGQLEASSFHGVELLVQVLNLHKDSVDAVESAVWALSNVSFYPENAVKALSLSSIAVIINAIKSFSENPDILARGCVCLSNMCVVQDDMSIFRDCIPTLIQVANAHVQDPDCAEQVCWILGNITEFNKQNQKIAVDAGVKSFLKKVEEQHKDDDDVMSQHRRVKKATASGIWSLFDVDWILS